MKNREEWVAEFKESVLRGVINDTGMSREEAENELNEWAKAPGPEWESCMELLRKAVEGN